MRFPRLLLLIVLLGFTLAFVQMGVISVAFEKLGLSRDSAFLLLLTTLFGSLINLPLFTFDASWTPAELPPPIRQIFRFDRPAFGGRTMVAANVGGCVTPVAFSIYLLAHTAVPFLDVVLAVATVAAAAHSFSRPLPGIGIGMPIFIAPLTAALAALLLDPEQRAVLAYVGGTLGVLIGADLLRLSDIRRLGVPVASIGGAGTFDGIFVTGVIAVLLA